MEKYLIVLFDGECSLCDRLVTFIIDRDMHGKFKFAPIRSEVGRFFIQKCNGNPDRVTAMYLIGEGKCYRASTAALRIAKQLSWPWPLLYGLIIIPSFIRNIFYFTVSKNRDRFFGKVNTCRIVTPELRERFLGLETVA